MMDQSSNMENTCYRLSLRLRLAHFIYFFFYDNDKGTRSLFQQNVCRYAYSLMEFEVYTLGTMQTRIDSGCPLQSEQ